MSAMFSESIELETSAGGHLFLTLSEDVGWEDFPAFADRLGSFLKFRVVEKCDTAMDRIWFVEFEDVKLSLVFQDYPLAVSLESNSDEGDALLKKLAQNIQPYSNRPINRLVTR